MPCRILWNQSLGRCFIGTQDQTVDGKLSMSIFYNLAAGYATAFKKITETTQPNLLHFHWTPVLVNRSIIGLGTCHYTHYI